MAREIGLPASEFREEAPGSAISWAAIIAGAVVASALAIALLALGAALGLSAVSPWSHANISAETFGGLAAAWLIAVQLFTSGTGGYVAGRLRTRWVGVHTDEVFFRDTAHGFVVWAVGGVVSALLLTSAASSIASGLAHVGASAAQSVSGAGVEAAQSMAPATSNQTDRTAYFADMLFRTDHPGSVADGSESKAELNRILVRGLSSGDLPAADKAYIVQVVASRTGLSQADAEKRVADVIGQAKNAEAQALEATKKAADVARKAGIYVALWVFVSLLIGAFSASYMATVGGRHRDEPATMATTASSEAIASRHRNEPARTSS